MRFIVLIALLGIAAANTRCPFGGKQSLNQLVQELQCQQNPQQCNQQCNDESDDDQESCQNQCSQGGDQDDDDQEDQEQCQQCQDDSDCDSGQCQQGQCQSQQCQQGGQRGQRCQRGQCQQGQQCQDDEDCENGQCQRGQCQSQQFQQSQQQRGQQCRQDQQGNLRCGGQQGQQQCRPKFQLLQQLEKPNCQMAAKLYQQAKQEQDDKNTVVSPAAVQLTLAALQKGAKGNTKAQIKRAQCPQLSQQQCQQAHAAFIRSLKGTNNVQQTQRPGGPSNGQQKATINCATGIILNQQTPAQGQFVQTVQKCLGGQVQKCSFKQNPQQCRQQINRLVSAKTCKKVQSIVPQQAVTENTKMIAVSALQVQAKWGQQFRQQQQTKQGRFYPLGSQKSKSCQVLQSQGRFNYFQDDQLQVVGIPTQKQELTMYVILPKDKNGLTQVEKQQVQNSQQLKQLLDNCDQQKQQMRVQLPKFQINTKLDAKKTCTQQGIQAAFDNDEADFSAISGQQQQQQQQIHLNKLIHQATIKVNEQGISSANTGSQSSNQDQIEEAQQQQQQYQQEDDEDNDSYQQNQSNQGNQVKANHAFAFAVKHNPSNQIILVGRVIDATQKPQQQGQGQDQDQDRDQNDQDDQDQE